MATIVGTSGNDNLTSTAEDDSIDGLGGNDTINLPASGYGDDVVNGGSGNDSLFFNFGGATAIVVNFGTGTATGSGTVSFSGIERVVATFADDHLIGAAGAQNLSGVGGHDTLEGRAGNDWLWGGAGNDRFVFRETGAANADNIGDFAGAADSIVLDGTVMTALGAEGQFTAGDARFAANSSGTAQDSSDRVVYNTTTRQLFYDADGSGSGAAQLIATLQSSATLSATNIVVEGGGTPPPGGATEGDDVLVGTPGPDTIDGLGGNDQISGLGGDDHLIGGSGNDTLDGGAGADALEGGSGNDTYLVLNDGDTLSDTGGVDTVIVTENDFISIWTLADGFENLILRGTSDFVVGTGNDLDNVITNEHHNFEGVLDGGHGDDTLIGGPYFEFRSGGGDYGHDFVDGAGDNGMLFVGDFSAAVVDFRNGTVVGGGEGGTGSIDFVNIGRVRGGNFADQFFAADSGSIALGGSGDDTFTGGAGADIFHDENPWYYDGPSPDTIGTGNDQLFGGGGDDHLTVTRGSNTVDGGDGNDSIRIGIGDYFDESYTFNDVIDGGAGIDMLTISNLSAVTVDLGAGTLTGGGAGGTGIASLTSIENFEAYQFGNFANRITGSSAANLLAGGAGDDWIAGRAGWDTLTGGTGGDTFAFAEFGAGINDTIVDLVSGEDTIELDAAAFTAIGASGSFAPGDGRFWAAPGATAGHDADDRVIYDTSTGVLYYDADGSGAGGEERIAILEGAPTLAATDIEVVNGSGGGGSGGGEHIVGTSGNDTLSGTDGDDTIEGLGGNDTINMLPADGYGNDVVDGGAGNDSLFFNFAGATAVTVDFGTGSASNSAGSVSFSGIERVVATQQNDHLIGAAGAQNLSGVGGNDILEGRAGNDWLWSGGGLDTFVFREFGGANADNIGDFASGSDTIALDNAVMTALGADGDFSAGDGRFRAAAGATGGADANDRVIYNTTTGQLYYDADGSGAGAAQLIATVQGAPGVTATDISVI